MFVCRFLHERLIFPPSERSENDVLFQLFSQYSLTKEGILANCK